MPGIIRKRLIIVAALLILALGGCDRLKKTEYAQDAAFVKNVCCDLLFVAFCRGA